MWAASWPAIVENAFRKDHHGDAPRWQDILKNLPVCTASRIYLHHSAITVEGKVGEETQQRIEKLLRELRPWRKGPYDLYGVYIDSEWRSDKKWQRLENHIHPLENRVVLDVGCGNGYHVWRMRGAGARLVVGIDPTLLNVVQFLAVQHFVGDHAVHVLPLGISDIPSSLRVFDTVFSMGVLYHRRSPLDHLIELKGCLRSGGELVLETLVIDGTLGEVLLPEDRYAQMRNVWFLPSCLTLESWLKRCGYKHIRLLSVVTTTPLEQRTTDWMPFQSLSNFLHPDHPEYTVEGLPAPKRAIFLAESP